MPYIARVGLYSNSDRDGEEFPQAVFYSTSSGEEYLSAFCFRDQVATVFYVTMALFFSTQAD